MGRIWSTWNVWGPWDFRSTANSISTGTPMQASLTFSRLVRIRGRGKPWPLRIMLKVTRGAPWAALPSTMRS